MPDLRFYIARFFRRFPYFLIVAVLISALSVVVALTLPPAYESDVGLIVESQQIPEGMAQGTVATPGQEQLQLIQQRLLTRQNLLDIANQIQVVRDQKSMSPDEIVQAMKDNTTIRSKSGRDQATVMTITYQAPTPEAAAGVANAYLTRILQQDVEYRTSRAENTLDFFQQQVTQLSQSLDEKSAQILEFKNKNTDALPETLEFRLGDRARLQDEMSKVESDIAAAQRQRDQLIQVAAAGLQGTDTAKVQLSPRELRLQQLQQQLDEARAIYAEQSPQVKRLVAQLDQLEAVVRGASGTEQTGAAPAGDPAAADDPEARLIAENPMLRVQLDDIDAHIRALEGNRASLETRIAAMSDAIARTPANAIALGALQRDFDNIQSQYNTAVTRMSQASTGERIEFLSRGQRVTVVQPPVVPSEPTKPDRKKLAMMGTAAGIAAGLALVVLIELLQKSPRRAEDIVARFDVMPIATIPYIRTRRQMIVDRSVKLLIILAILIGIPAAIYAVHVYYMPIDLLADKVMGQFGIHL